MNSNLIIFLLILLQLDSDIRLSFPLNFITCKFPYFYVIHGYFNLKKIGEIALEAVSHKLFETRCYSNISKINFKDTI